jgi:hypothetical protein
LGKRGKAVENLQEDLKDGLKLLSFLEVISGKTVATKYEKKPTMRIQKIQNLDMCLKFLANEKVQLISIGAEGLIQRARLLTRTKIFATETKSLFSV